MPSEETKAEPKAAPKRSKSKKSKKASAPPPTTTQPAEAPPRKTWASQGSKTGPGSGVVHCNPKSMIEAQHPHLRECIHLTHWLETQADPSCFEHVSQNRDAQEYVHIVNMTKMAHPRRLDAALYDGFIKEPPPAPLTLQANRELAASEQVQYAGGHLPNDEELAQVVALEEAKEAQTHEPPAELPETWTCPATGQVMWREERYAFLAASPDFRSSWTEAFNCVCSLNKRSHLNRKAIKVTQTGLCTWEEAFLALAETRGDEIEAMSRLRNEQYRWEIALAHQVVDGVVKKYLSQSRVRVKKSDMAKAEADLEDHVGGEGGGGEQDGEE